MRKFLYLEKIIDDEYQHGGFKVRFVKPKNNEVWYYHTGSYLRRGKWRPEKGGKK